VRAAAAADWPEQQLQEQQQQQGYSAAADANSSSAAHAAPASPAAAAAGSAMHVVHDDAAFTPQGLHMLLWGVDKMRRHKALPESWQESVIAATMRALRATVATAPPQPPAAAAAAVADAAGFYAHERARPAPGAFAPAELPSVLYYMIRIKAAPPVEWLALFSDAMAPCVPAASPRLLAQLLFALARARAAPAGALLDACLARAGQLRGGFSPGDEAMLLWSLGVLAGHEGADADALSAIAVAADGSSGGRIGSSGSSGMPYGGVTTAWLDGHLAGMEGRLRAMDHKQLAMVIWALGRLQHRPSPAWMGSFLAAARQLLGTTQPPPPPAGWSPAGGEAGAFPHAGPAAAPGPLSSNDTGGPRVPSSSAAAAGGGMSLLSVSTLLASLQALDFLPPSGFMAAAHSAAAAAIWEDPTPSLVQRELLSERVNTAVAWYKQRMQQLVGSSGGGGSPTGSMASCEEAGGGGGSNGSTNSAGSSSSNGAALPREGDSGGGVAGPAVVAAAAAAVVTAAADRAADSPSSTR
jgi:hypothetical protein